MIQMIVFVFFVAAKFVVIKKAYLTYYHSFHFVNSF